jgi:hypothetical protein
LGVAFIFVAALGVLEVLLTFDLGLAVFALIVAAAGCSMTVFVVGVHGVLSIETEQQFQGRVGALYTYVVFALGPLGSSISGWLGEIGGTDLAFMVGGFVALFVAAAGIVTFERFPSRSGHQPVEKTQT